MVKSLLHSTGMHKHSCIPSLGPVAGSSTRHCSVCADRSAAAEGCAEPATPASAATLLYQIMVRQQQQEA